MIETDIEPGIKGGKSVSMRLSDGVGEIISLRLAMPDEAQAKAVEKRFRAGAEDIYNQIVEILTKE